MMAVKVICADYGFECGFILEGDASISLVEKLRDHFENEHGIDYPVAAVIQMLTNHGQRRDSFKDS